MINRDEFPIPVATVGRAVVYTCLKPKDDSYDGYVSTLGEATPIKVYRSYVQAKEDAVQRNSEPWKLMDSTEFHRQFWEMPARRFTLSPKEWMSTFVNRSMPIPDEILSSINVSSADIYGKKSQ